MLMKYRPTPSLMNPFFEDFWTKNSADENAKISPNTDILERKNDYLIFAEMPGVKKDEFKVDLDKNILTIRGKKEIHTRQDGEQFARVERQCGDYLRSFRLGEEIDTDKISAEYDSGVLKLTLPKSEKVKPKSVEIKVK